MSAHSKIEWTDHTFNPWEGCQKVGPGCDHCYAETRNARFGGGQAVNWGPGAPRRRTSAKNWYTPFYWNDQAFEFQKQHGRRQRVFCASLADVFDKAVDPQWRADLFELILATPKLDWLLLTKRVGNVAKMVPPAWMQPDGWPAHVRIGATIVNPEEAARDIPKLLALPCPNFLSMEPLLAAVDVEALPFGPPCTGCGEPVRLDALTGSTSCLYACDGPKFDGIDWVIVGGESGPGARPMHPDWARSLRDQCQTAGVPFLFKQWGEWKPISQMEEAEHCSLFRSRVKARDGQDQSNLDDICGRYCTVDTRVQQNNGAIFDIPTAMAFEQGTGAMQIFKIGKKAAGRQLDGRTWDEVPA